MARMGGLVFNELRMYREEEGGEMIFVIQGMSGEAVRGVVKNGTIEFGPFLHSPDGNVEYRLELKGTIKQAREGFIPLFSGEIT